MFEQYVRYNFSDEQNILQLVVAQQNRDEKLTSLREIASVGRVLIQSRLAGDLCRDANCGSLALFLSRVLEDVAVRAGEGSWGMGDLARQLSTADHNAVQMERAMRRQVSNLFGSRIGCHVFYMFILGMVFWFFFISKSKSSENVGGRSEKLISFGENFAPTLYSGFLHCVERIVGKKSKGLNDTLETCLWLNKVERVTASVIHLCGPPPPPPPSAPALRNAHRNVIAGTPNTTPGSSTPGNTTPGSTSAPRAATHTSWPRMVAPLPPFRF